MAFGTQDGTDDVMNEINMTPMVDIMLVLLIIFIITVPVMKHAVSIDLPKATNEAQIVKPETLPETLEVTATTDDGLIMGLQHRSRPLHGVQFHPESIASENGHALLQNFLNIARDFNKKQAA